ncbi:uncharacterized protein [Watersipora subatra]|uniref:uncharacterized protein n=1 Tax=Watersipora subatra TaxID=2589382 RepID=UPI00355C22CB
MGNSLNCASGNAHKPRDHSKGMIDQKESFVDYMSPNDPANSSVAPDLLPIEAAHFAKERRVSRKDSAVGSLPNSPKSSNNNERSDAFAFEKAFKLSQLQSPNPPLVTIPLPSTANGTEDGSTSPKPPNNSENCYVNIKPFSFPLPPLPDNDNLNNSHCSISSGGAISQEEVTPPSTRRRSERLSALEELDNIESPKLPPRPSRLTLCSMSSASQLPVMSTPLQIADDNVSEESAIKSPPPRQVVFTDLFADSLGSEGETPEPYDFSMTASNTSKPEVNTSVIKKRPKKPPRNYSYRAATLPKRISHTTEEVMELWDEVRKALSLERLKDTTSLHISEEEDDEDEIYQNLYAARMRSWQIMCLAQDVLLERLKPDRVWECFLSESLVSEVEYETLGVAACDQKMSNQLIIDRILEHGDGWFDRLREILRIHEDQRQISNLLEALNDVFIIGAKANKWTFSLTTKHCTVRQARPSSISDQPDLIGDTAEGLQPIVWLEVYDENFGNTSCTALGEVLRKYNVISQLNLGKNRLTPKGISKLCPGIQGNRCLEKLNLRLNPLENEGLAILSKALERNGSIKELILCHTQLQVGAGDSLAHIFSHNSSLEVIDLSYNELTDADCSCLASGLERNQSLLTLNLRGNQITHEGCKQIVAALRTNISLQALDLSHNQVTDKGLYYLSEIVHYYDNLRELHLESCGITQEGCAMLTEALSENHSLAALYLSNNPIGDEGCETLADMLVNNIALQTLYLNLCSINRTGLHRLLTVISHDNFTLRTLGVCNNNIEVYNDDLVQDGFEAVDIRNALNRALEHNKERKILTWGKALS